MRDPPLILLLIIAGGSVAFAGPSTQPSREVYARARAEAVAMVRPSGPILGAPVAFDPVPRPLRRFANEYDRYIYTVPACWFGYGGSGYGYGFGFGFGWGWGCGWGGSFHVGGSYQNSSGGVGW